MRGVLILRRCAGVICGMLALAVLAAGFFAPAAAEDTAARPSRCGALRVEDACPVSEAGEKVVLRGVSTHGLTYYPEFVNAALFSRLSAEWDCSLVRLAMYPSEYCKSARSKANSLSLIESGISYAVAADMYVICDWHTLDEHDPNVYVDEAAEFFGLISEKYAACPNVIYEICNEPNGDTSWADIKAYAGRIIPVIKANNPDAVIIVGTPSYSSDLLSAAADPITGYTNILYAFHFYAESHGEEYKAELINAVESGLPVFVSECGITSADGDGGVDYAGAEEWFSLLNRYGISCAVWNLSDKPEASSMVRNIGADPERLTDKDLSPCGQYVKAFLRGTALSDIPGLINEERTFRELFLNNIYFAYGCIALGALAVLLLQRLITRLYGQKALRSYDALLNKTGSGGQNRVSGKNTRRAAGKFCLMLSAFTTIIYLTWRVCFSIPKVYGSCVPSAFSVLLLIVEVTGFIESCIHYSAMIHLRDYPLPQIGPEEYPHVDVFVSTYNEPAEILRKTLIGCKNMSYPDKSKVHIYLCDDNRRPEMERLAAEIGVGYFKRPDNRGAKAGNLNAALARTDSPYVVTFDADMIPRREFLLKTIPYFVDAQKRNAALSEAEQMPLGFIQTPQSFYNPDIFQYNLYAEKRVPNEQDFFYRTIEPAKTCNNSVIYGGSNTVLSRNALDTVGGFYTGSITEDFATGLLIEASGYVSLGLNEPLASGLSPSGFKEHIQQRVRWGRGVILTARKLHIIRSKRLSLGQKLSYMSSVVFWYSSVKNWIYVLAPLMFAAAGVPVMRCSLGDILLFWVPMFLMQSLTLRLISAGSISLKRSGIQETALMPFLFFPILKESVGISLSAFKVTDKRAGAVGKQTDFKLLVPFIALILLSLFGIARVLVLLCKTRAFGLISVLYWLFRNLYFLLMSLFLADGRDLNGENVTVKDGEPITVSYSGAEYSGITTSLTEHGISMFADDNPGIGLGESVTIDINGMLLGGVVVALNKSRNGRALTVFTAEILDFGGKKDDYICFLYDRVPTLPQSLDRDIGFFRDLWINLIRHLSARTKY